MCVCMFSLFMSSWVVPGKKGGTARRRRLFFFLYLIQNFRCTFFLYVARFFKWILSSCVS